MSKPRISSRLALVVCALLSLLVPSSAVAAGPPPQVPPRAWGGTRTNTPPPARANAGEAVTVTVVQYNAQGEAKPAVGANVGGGGTGAVTDAQGHATLRFSGDATYMLRISGAESTPAIRTETTICVHEGNDGTCGTSSPSKRAVPPPASSV